MLNQVDSQLERIKNSIVNLLKVEGFEAVKIEHTLVATANYGNEDINGSAHIKTVTLTVEADKF